jgi:hypothetical protein
MHGPYRERYNDFTVKHFHEQIVRRHITSSVTRRHDYRCEWRSRLPRGDRARTARSERANKVAEPRLSPGVRKCLYSPKYLSATWIPSS